MTAARSARAPVAPSPHGWPTPASPARSTTRPSCSRTPSARPAGSSPSSTTSTDEQVARFEELVARRAAREPLQHLTGIDRLPLRRAAGRARGSSCPGRRPSCSPAGPIERAREAGRAPRRRRPVHRLRRDRRERRLRGPGARACTPSSWTRPPSRGPSATSPATGVDLRLGDMADAFPELDGTVDVVVCNPPYIPLEAFESVAPEARDHDPALALWSGEDGLDAMRVLEATAARLLRPGGWVGAEHADVQGESATRVFLERRSLDRRTRPPGPGRSCALRRRRDWHDDPVRRTDVSDPLRPGRPEEPRGRAGRRRDRRTPWPAGRAPDRHRLRHRCGRLRRRRGAAAPRRQGPRPRHAAAGADLGRHHPRGARHRAARLGERPGRAVLARPADDRVPPAAVAALGPRRDPRHRRHPDARRRGRPRPARPHRPAGGLLGQQHRPPGRHRRRRGRGDARLGRSR